MALLWRGVLRSPARPGVRTPARRLAAGRLGSGGASGDGGYNVDLLAVAGSSSEKPFMMINSYSRSGFRVSGVQLEGSVCVAPHASFLWRAQSLSELSVDSLRFITLLEPPIDIVVIGCGRRASFGSSSRGLAPGVGSLDPSVRRFFERERIALEVQTSPNACAMFNFLNQENRRALALLLPLEASDPHRGE